MKALIIALLLSVSQVLGAHIHSIIQSNEELLLLLDKPSIFLPGIFASKVLKKIERPFHPRLLMMDIADSFQDMAGILIKRYTDSKYTTELVKDSSDVEIATFVFRIDSFLEFLTYQSLKNRKALKKLFSARTLIVGLVKEAFPYRRLLVELIATSPSLLIATVINYGDTTDGITPMSYLHQVDSLVTSKSVDPFGVMNLKSAIIGCSASCLSDFSVSEHEKQLWITQFADSCFWMSSTQVAMCIARMLHAKRYNELALLQYNFTLEQWKMASDFLENGDVKCFPEVFQILLIGTNIEEYRQVLDALLVEFQDHCFQNASTIMKTVLNYQNDVSDAILLARLFQTVENYATIEDVFNDTASRQVDFTIVYALLILLSDIQNRFKVKHPNIVKLGKVSGPVKEIFSSNVLPLFGSNNQNMIHGKKHKVPTEAFSSILLGLIRSLRPVLSAYNEQTGKVPLKSLLQPDDKLVFSNENLKDSELFFRLCDLICKYEMGKDDLESDLNEINFGGILNTNRLSLPLKTILFEGIVGMYLCRSQGFPEILKYVSIGGPSLSQTVGSLRSVKKATDVSHFVAAIRNTQPEQPDHHSAAHAMFMWAMMPRIMEDDAGADDFVTAINADLQSNEQFQPICNTAFKMIYEFTSATRLRQIIPRFSERFGQIVIPGKLSISRRTKLLSDLFNLEVPNYNNTMLSLLVKKHVPENSIEYAKNYFTAQAKLDPILLAHAIVEAITLIGQGKKKTVQLFPKLILAFIFMKDLLSHRGFFNRVRYELELHLHLSIVPKEIKIKIIDLICVSDDTDGKQIRFMEDLGKLCKGEYAVAETVVASKKQGSTPSPNLRKPPIFISTSVSKSHVTAAQIENHIKASSVADPKRPSRSRPRPIIQTAKVKKGASEQKTVNLKQIQPKNPKKQESNIPQPEPPKPQADFDVKQTSKKRKYHIESVQIDSSTSAQEAIANSQQAQINCEQLPSPLASAAPTSEEQIEMKREPKAFKLTTKLLRKNAIIQTDGQVMPKNDCSTEFREYIEEEVKVGILPFKLHPHLLSYLTRRENRELFKNTPWKPIKEWKDRKVWKPKLHSPIKVFVNRVGLDKISDLKEYVYQLPQEQVARLQSLCYYSNLSTLLSKQGVLSRWTLKFEISAKTHVYRINQGWIQIPRFPETLQEFLKAVAHLTESPVADSSTEIVASNALKPSKQAKGLKKKVQPEPSLPIDSVASVVFDKAKKAEQASTDTFEVGEENGQAVLSLATLKKNADEDLKQYSSNMIEEKTLSSSPETNLRNVELKVTSPEFVPNKTGETERLSCLQNFTQIRFNVTPSNYEHMLPTFFELLSNGVEYVALDCEMTGLYTRADEAEHCKDQSLRKVDNTIKLIAGVDENSMFQLGLTVKSHDGKFYIWSFFTDLKLTRESFTPETFNFLFLKQYEGKAPSEDSLCEIESRIKSIAMNSVSVGPFLSWLLHLRTPLVLFSGYVDLMHILKACGREWVLSHEQMHRQLECDIYDIKLIAKLILNRSGSLESLMQELHAGLDFDKQHLHDASYDSLLTALAYEKLRDVYGKECMLKNVLFNYESQ